MGKPSICTNRRVGVSLTWHVKDGDKVDANTVLVSLEGSARAILTAERTALNFLQTLSATATVTAFYAKYLDGSNTKILDTRKTLPGLRHTEIRGALWWWSKPSCGFVRCILN